MSNLIWLLKMVGYMYLVGVMLVVLAVGIGAFLGKDE